MQLKKLELQGFKSFADKTEIEFLEIEFSEFVRCDFTNDETCMANYKIIRRGEEEIERETSFFPRKEAFSFSRLKYVARRLRNFEFPDF